MDKKKKKKKIIVEHTIVSRKIDNIAAKTRALVWRLFTNGRHARKMFFIYEDFPSTSFKGIFQEHHHHFRQAGLQQDGNLAKVLCTN